MEHKNNKYLNYMDKLCLAIHMWKHTQGQVILLLQNNNDDMNNKAYLIRTDYKRYINIYYI